MSSKNEPFLSPSAIAATLIIFTGFPASSTPSVTLVASNVLSSEPSAFLYVYELSSWLYSSLVFAVSASSTRSFNSPDRTLLVPLLTVPIIVKLPAAVVSRSR